MIKKLLPYLLIITFSIVGLWSLIKSPFYTSHDGFTHTARIMAYYEALKDGQFPPRWATKFAGNLGSPIFVYSYPLPYFLGAILHFGGIHYQDAYRIVLGGGYLLSGLAAFWWLSSRFGKKAGLVGAIFYLWVPYRFLNIYVRGAFAESFAYTFIPLIFLSIERLSETKKTKWGFLLSFATAGLLLTHNLVAAMFLPAMGLLVLLLGWRQNGWKQMFQSYLFLGAGFLMSSFIYLPDFLERGYVHFDEGISYWQNYFVAWWQLIRSHWGYGFDFPGTVNDDMSFQLGLTQILTAGILLLVLAYLLVKRKFDWKKIVNVEGIFFLILLLVAIFLMVDEPLAVIVWKELPLIKTIIDFPWRFLGMTLVTFSFLVAYLVYLTKSLRVVVIVLLFLVFMANRNHIRVNKVESFTDKEFEGYHGTSTAGSNEYNPIWHKSNKLPGDLESGYVSNMATGTKFEVTAESGEIRINRFYFPETDIYRDGQQLKIGTDYEIIRSQKDTSFDDTGLMKLVKPRKGNYYLSFQETPLRKAANWLSLVSFIVVSFGGIVLLVRRRI